MSNSEKQPQRNGDQDRTGYQEISQRKKGRLIETHTLGLIVHVSNPSMRRRRKIGGSRPKKEGREVGWLAEGRGKRRGGK